MPCFEAIKTVIFYPFAAFGLNPQNYRGPACFHGRAVSVKPPRGSSSENLSKIEFTPEDCVTERKKEADGVTRTNPRGHFKVTSPLLAVCEKMETPGATSPTKVAHNVIGNGPTATDQNHSSGRARDPGMGRGTSVDSDVALLDALIAAGTRPQSKTQRNNADNSPESDESNGEMVQGQHEDEDVKKSNSFANYWATNSNEPRDDKGTPRPDMPSVLRSNKFHLGDPDSRMDDKGQEPEENGSNGIGDLDI